MSKADDLKLYLPRYYETSRQMEAIADTEGIELDNLVLRINETLDQFFINTASWGLDRWEQEFNIPVDTAKDQQERRSVIMSKKRGIGKVSMELIKNVIKPYSGGTVDVLYGYQMYSFGSVRITDLTPNIIFIRFIDSRGIPPNLDDLKAVLEEIKPAHMMIEYQFRYLIWDELDAQEITWDGLDGKNLTWDEFETGGWL